MNAKNHLHLSFIPLLNIWSGSIIRLLYQTLSAAWVLNAFGREKPLCVAIFAQRIQSKKRSLSLDVLKAQRAPLQGCNHRLKDNSANYRRKVFSCRPAYVLSSNGLFFVQSACSVCHIACYTPSLKNKLTAKKDLTKRQRSRIEVPFKWGRQRVRLGLMLLSQQIVHGFHGVERGQWHLYEHRVPIAHGSIPQPR